MGEKLRTCGLICEYNPFHYGHAYQLSELKKRFDAVVCILGGNLTQRGQVAVADRYDRAKAALAGGADLVVELPLPWCCSSASEFALGGVAIAKGLGVDALAFSAESDEQTLRTALQKKEQNAPELARLTREEHLSYPKAVERVCGIPLADRPNDILGICYLSHLGDLPACVLKRDPSFRSSREIRASETPESLLPACSLPLLPFRDDETVYPFLRAAFINGGVRDCAGMTDELFASLCEEILVSGTFSSLRTAAASKQFTSSRVSRALWASVLRIPASLPHTLPPYTLLLAANETGRQFLKEHKNDRVLQVISRPGECQGDPVFALNLRADRVLNSFFETVDDLVRKPFLP